MLPQRKEVAMIRYTVAIRTLVLLAAVVSSVGCATSHNHGGEAARPGDVRAAATVIGTAPRLVVAGPAVLMHIEVEGRDDLYLYTVARNQGTDADCAAAAVEQTRLRKQVSNRVNLRVGADQSICVAADTSRASVTWHARRVDSASSGGQETLALQDR
jgi:hypothetical protein